MATPDNLTHATFTPTIGDTAAIPVQFNPASLQYTVSNTLKEEGEGKKRKQYVSQTSGKLTMDLIFDTTDDGSDVRLRTSKLMRLMHPVPEGKKSVPAVIEFRWGNYVFKGIIESYKETIDFFSADGVPLRAAVNLSLSEQEVTFSPGTNQPADTRASMAPEPVVLPPGQGSPSDIARQAGNPGAASGLARANGQESMRFSSGPIAVSASVQLKGPSAFSAGASGGIGGGIGLSGGIGGGIGVSGGIGGSIGAGASVSAAGVPASAGAFAELRASVGGVQASFNAAALLPKVSVGGSVSGAAPGGQASGGSMGLKADVGAKGGLSASIQFED